MVRSANRVVHHFGTSVNLGRCDATLAFYGVSEYDTERAGRRGLN